MTTPIPSGQTRQTRLGGRHLRRRLTHHALHDRHVRFVRWFGRTGWLYLSAAVPWLVLLVLLRSAIGSDDPVEPTHVLAFVGTTFVCSRIPGTIRRTRRAGLPPAP